MAFEATKKEWSEIYSVFRMLADGYVYAGTVDVKRSEADCLPVVMIQREEHDGTRRYIVDKENVVIVGDNINRSVCRRDFGNAAELILQALKQSSADMVEAPTSVEKFLDEILIYDLEAKTSDRTDYYISFYAMDVPPVGFSVRSRIGLLVPLLDGGRTANFSYELKGTKFAVPTVNKVNALECGNEVVDRMLMIERLGGILKYNDVTDKVFRSNLSMIDLHFPRVLGEMLRIMQLDGITKVSELTEQVKIINPLKIKDELIKKHGFYDFKIRQFLMALALGMRPAKIYNGTDSAVSGFIFVNGNGEILCYSLDNRKIFEDFLFFNTRLEKGSTEKDKYGYLERENGTYYFKLNLKIGLLKR